MVNYLYFTLSSYGEKQMNYEKKRKRQNGRQAKREPKYNIWIDKYDRLHATIDRLIEEGTLPAIDFNPTPIEVVGF